MADDHGSDTPDLSRSALVARLERAMGPGDVLLDELCAITPRLKLVALQMSM